MCNHMKGAKSWPDLNQAKAEICKYWDQMRAYWEVNVLPLVNQR